MPKSAPGLTARGREHSLDVVSREAEITQHRHEPAANSEFDWSEPKDWFTNALPIPPLQGQRPRRLVRHSPRFWAVLPSNAPKDLEKLRGAAGARALIPVGDVSGAAEREPVCVSRALAGGPRPRVSGSDGRSLSRIMPGSGFYGGSADIIRLRTEPRADLGNRPASFFSGASRTNPAAARVRQAKGGHARRCLAGSIRVLNALKETEQSPRPLWGRSRQTVRRWPRRI